MKLLASMSVALLLISCAKKELPGNLHLSGYVAGLKKGTIYIQKVVDTNLVILDTIQINGDAHFTSNLTIDSPEMYYLFLDRGVSNSLDNNLPFFAEAGNINIATSLAYFLVDAKITGSKNHEKYDEYKLVMARYNDIKLSLLEEKFKAYKNKNTKAVDSIQVLENDNTKREYLYTTNFALNHKAFAVAPFVTLSNIANVNLKYLDTIQKSMTPQVANSLYGKKLIQLYKERYQTEK
ncbi:MAG: DUF4369 domain-containing protein [Flavobacterium sp.]|nr:DUF4369 domain-containing protein [Flavobacterium sp.]